MCLEGRYPEAIAALQRSIALRPSLDAYGNLGYTYTLMHQYPEAISALTTGTEARRSRLAELGQSWRCALLEPGPTRRGRCQVSQGDLHRIFQTRGQSRRCLTSGLSGRLLCHDRRSSVGFSISGESAEARSSNGEVLFRAAIVHKHFNETGSGAFLPQESRRRRLFARRLFAILPTSVTCSTIPHSRQWWK